MSSRWVDAASSAELARQRFMEIEAEGTAILLYDIAGTAYATAAVCPHHSAWLSQGGLEGDLVDCPRHQGQFHVPTGRKTRGPECPDLRTYPVRVEDGRVWVNVA
jgi:naphthalene 1,2-dioxygenase system ferredoxin subunit